MAQVGKCVEAQMQIAYAICEAPPERDLHEDNEDVTYCPVLEGLSLKLKRNMKNKSLSCLRVIFFFE